VRRERDRETESESERERESKIESENERERERVCITRFYQLEHKIQEQQLLFVDRLRLHAEGAWSSMFIHGE
jgi:hypothetical protein